MQKSIIIIVFILMLSSLLTGASFQVTQKIKENPMHLGLQMLDDNQKYDSEGKLCALLVIRCGIEDINFENMAAKVAQIDQEGTYLVTLKENASYIVMKKAGYGSYKEAFEFKLKSGTVYEMSVDGERMLNQIPVLFSTNPSGVEIFLNDTSQGRTSSGKLSVTAPEGKYLLRCVLAEFETIEDSIEIKSGNQTFEYKLVEAMDATVTIDSNPQGATVYIKGIKFGETPKTGFFPLGTYTIKLEKESFDTIEEQITITNPTSKSYTLEDARATLTINTHAQATVYLNNDAGHKGGVKDYKLSPQMVEIRVEMPKVAPIIRSVLLEKKAVVVKDFYPDVQTGSVLVNVIPPDAVVELKGEAGIFYTNTGRCVFEAVPVGSYELTVKAEKYKSFKESFSLALDENVIRQITLEAGSDKPVEVTPPSTTTPNPGLRRRW
ncbi:MAG: PEGA domain-containing protein [Candidatus Cloacimonetes bacterium]|nr:PEGA domain-containing protein [Candidatus Cloacimonadota bacterium]